LASLQLSNITKRYRKQIVLDAISLDVPSGETLVLFGPSGSGKSVLLRLIAGVIDPDEGQVLIDGEDVTAIEADERGVGMAFQNFALFPHMNAFDNIAAPLEARAESGEAIRRNVERIAGLLKIGHVLGHAPRALSNGQKQRTALARALVASPPVLLLDDPLRNVDAKLRFEMRLELPRLLAREGATVVYVTQDYREAMALGQRIAVMAEGRVVQLGSPEDIYLAPATIEIARLFGDPPINILGAETGLVPGLDPGRLIGIRPESLRFVSAGEPGSHPIAIEAETPLNEKVVTLAVLPGGQELLISRPAGKPGPAVGAAAIAFDPASLMLFDKASGRRIGAEPIAHQPAASAGAMA
jgi:multiple sugar transport system ATP-binding protein